MSQIEVDKIIPQSGTSTQLGESGDTITIPAGATITNNGTANGFGSADTEKVKVSANDTTAGFLNGKLVAGTNISLTEGSDGGNETLTAALSGTIPTARLGSGTASSSTFLRGDQTYAAAGSPSIDDNGNATAMTITSDEDIGIGLTNPAHKLSVFDSSTGIVARFATTGNRSLDISSADNGSYAGAIWDRDINSAGGIHTWSVEGNEAMRINSSKNAILGSTSQVNAAKLSLKYANTANDGLGLEQTNNDTLGYAVIFKNTNGIVGTITNQSSGTAFNTSSDYRLKENVDYTFDATTRLKQLKPARFNFIADDTNTLVDGFIAHEVSDIVPEAVSGTKDAMAVETRYTADDVETQGDNPSKNVGDVKTYSTTEINPQGIDQSKLVPLLVKTIQELEARITQLENA